MSDEDRCPSKPEHAWDMRREDEQCDLAAGHEGWHEQVWRQHYPAAAGEGDGWTSSCRVWPDSASRL